MAKRSWKTNPEKKPTWYRRWQRELEDEYDDFRDARHHFEDVVAAFDWLACIFVIGVVLYLLYMFCYSCWGLVLAYAG